MEHIKQSCENLRLKLANPQGEERDLENARQDIGQLWQRMQTIVQDTGKQRGYATVSVDFPQFDHKKASYTDLMDVLGMLQSFPQKFLDQVLPKSRDEYGRMYEEMKVPMFHNVGDPLVGGYHKVSSYDNLFVQVDGWEREKNTYTITTEKRNLTGNGISSDPQTRKYFYPSHLPQYVVTGLFPIQRTIPSDFMKKQYKEYIGALQSRKSEQFPDALIGAKIDVCAPNKFQDDIWISFMINTKDVWPHIPVVMGKRLTTDEVPLEKKVDDVPLSLLISDHNGGYVLNPQIKPDDVAKYLAGKIPLESFSLPAGVFAEFLPQYEQMRARYKYKMNQYQPGTLTKMFREYLRFYVPSQEPLVQNTVSDSKPGKITLSQQLSVDSQESSRESLASPGGTVEQVSSETTESIRVRTMQELTPQEIQQYYGANEHMKNQITLKTMSINGQKFLVYVPPEGKKCSPVADSSLLLNFLDNLLKQYSPAEVQALIGYPQHVVQKIVGQSREDPDNLKKYKFHLLPLPSDSTTLVIDGESILGVRKGYSTKLAIAY
ncbi:MAG: hypothetical protein NZL83_00670 [Candidatus Absconditabacterales bacterium]|nr:hypothetical protein [Candidatus Absconditabacterales bacterium]